MTERSFIRPVASGIRPVPDGGWPSARAEAHGRPGPAVSSGADAARVAASSPAPSARLLAAARAASALEPAPGPVLRRASARAAGHPSPATGRISPATGRMKDRSVTTG